MAESFEPVTRVGRHVRKRQPLRLGGRGDGFLKKSGQFLIGTLVRTLAQGGLFVVLAREMPIREYGLFVGVTALITIISPFASLGTPSLLLQNHADDPKKWARHLAGALVLSGTASAAATVVIVLAGVAIWRDSVGWAPVLGLALADLVPWRLIEVAAMSVQARGAVFVASMLPAGLHVARLAAAIILISLGPLDLPTWAATSAILSGFVCLATVLYSARGSGGLRFEFRRSFAQTRTGLLFAVGLYAQTVYNDMDKVMLSRLSTPEGAAIYAAAYRVVDFAYVPMRSMAAVAYPKFFEAGKDGVRSAFRLTRRLLPKYLLYSVPVSLLLVAFAWVMPYIFGHEFAAAEFALQGLAALLVLKSLHYLAADTLSGSRLQVARTVAQVGVAFVNVLLNLWLIPAYGWPGAVASSLASDALLVVLLWSTLFIVIRRQRPASTTVGVAPRQAAEGAH